MDRANDDEVLQTERLLLRRWRPGDLAIVAPHYADPEVMVYLFRVGPGRSRRPKR
jgi:RimJ/RimL family protein N-acetyltransferase